MKQDRIKNGFECVFYNGENQDGSYEILEFDPTTMTMKELSKKAWKYLENKYGFDENQKQEVMETVYLLESEKLITVGA